MNWYKIIYAGYEDYQNQVENLSNSNPYPFSDWFDSNGRVYIPFDINQAQESGAGVDADVQAVLEQNGFQIIDYRKGICAKGNRQYRIGKTLNNIKNNQIKEVQQAFEAGNVYNLDRSIQEINSYMDSVINLFINSTFRIQKGATQLYVVISQNPHDVAQMSTGRNWTSCMSLGGDGEDVGLHHEDVFCEIERGGLVAYLINQNDTEIQNPLARIHIRRFDNRDGSSVAMPEQSVYGDNVQGFQEFVTQWLNQKQAMTPGVYKRQGGEYSDTFDVTELVKPQKAEELIEWFRGSAKDAVYSEYIVNDEMYEEYMENMEEIGQQFDEWNTPSIENYSDKFKTEEEALAYIEQTKSWGEGWDQYEREVMEDYSSSWNREDEETGEYDRDRFELQEKKYDNAWQMKNKAVDIILNAKKGVYPAELIQEIKEYALSRTGAARQFYTKYPELITEEDYGGMKDSDSLSYIKNLPAEKQEIYKAEWADNISSTLNDASNIANRDLEENILPIIQGYEQQYEANPKIQNDEGFRDKWSQAAGRVQSGLEANLYDYIINPLKEIFSPVPEKITQQLLQYPSQVVEKFFGHPFYKETGLHQKVLMRMNQDLIKTFSSTNSDTPAVQQFYGSLLPYFDNSPNASQQRNAGINIENLGNAIAKLGENGKQFLPWMKRRLIHTREDISQLEKKQSELSPGSFHWTRAETDINSHRKHEERLLYIVDALESGAGKSQKYRWSKSMNWYKTAQQQGTMLGYKVMRVEDGYFVSGADSRIKLPMQVGVVHTMPGAGIFLGRTPEYVKDYYFSGGFDPEDPKEFLLTYEFNPNDITSGNLEDREWEISVPSAKLLNMEQLN